MIHVTIKTERERESDAFIFDKVRDTHITNLPLVEILINLNDFSLVCRRLRILTEEKLKMSWRFLAKQLDELTIFELSQRTAI